MMTSLLNDVPAMSRSRARSGPERLRTMRNGKKIGLFEANGISALSRLPRSSTSPVLTSAIAASVTSGVIRASAPSG